MPKVPEVRPKRTVPKKKRPPNHPLLRASMGASPACRSKKSAAQQRREKIHDETGGLSTRLAKNLHKLRRASGLSQRAAAERAGMTLRCYQRLEAGEINAKIMTLAPLANAFGVNPDALIRKPRPRRRSRR